MVLPNDIDLLNPPAELEKRKHKLKRREMSRMLQHRKKNLVMDDFFPINISSDDENSLISSRSGMMAPSPPVESRSKRKRVTRKKKEPNENKGPITVNRKIPQGTIKMLHPIGPLGVAEVCETRHYLAGKKVILYGLPGYLSKPYTSGWSQKEYLRRSKIWNDFRVERVIKPAYEFIDRIDKLIGQGVNEALLFTGREMSRMLQHYHRL